MIGCIPGGFPDCGKELLSEVVSHHAVDDEVDAGVENSGEVRDVSETLDPSLGQERMISFSPQQEFIARNNILQVIELPDVDDGPWGVELSRNLCEVSQSINCPLTHSRP